MKKYFLILAVVFLPFIILAGNPQIISVTMDPPNPSFGDTVQITVNYCGQMYQDHRIAIAVSTQPVLVNADLSGVGQVFVVSRAGVDAATSQPATVPGGEIGYIAQLNPGGGTAECMTCGSGSNDGLLFTKIYTVHIPPASYFPGCNLSNLYIHVGMKDNNIGSSEWMALPACQVNSSLSWTVPVLPRGFGISKRVDGVLQSVNDMVLFSVDYEYENGGLSITDSIPGGGNFALVSFGPSAIASGPPVGATSGSITWTMPDRTGVQGKALGTVWMLLKLNTAVPAGTMISNTATGIQAGSTNETASAAITVGQESVSLTKSQSSTQPLLGGPLTYYLNYSANGIKLAGYDTFDSTPIGTYGSLNSTGGAPVPGWSFVPQAATEGQWVVSDLCGNGDRIITGDVTAGDRYPAILYDGLPAGNNMCSGMIMTDVLINPGGYEGADASIAIRSDGTTPNAKFYSLVLSVDDFIGTNINGNVGFERCDGATCIWPLSINTVQVTSSTWYRVKIEIDAANQYSFRAKVWPKGDPEPGAWTLSWTDVAPPAGFDCNSGAAWKPGLREMHGASGDVHDSYNNFMVFSPFAAGPVEIWDTIPTGLSYVGSAGQYLAVVSGSLLRWDISSLANGGGTLTWWGTAVSCGDIANTAMIGGAGLSTNSSNMVTANVLCPSSTVTRTFTITPTPSMTYVVGTAIPTNTNTITRTISLTPTITHTISETTTASLSPTFTETLTPTTAPTYYASCWSDLDGTGIESLNLSKYYDGSATTYYEFAVNPAGTPYVSFVRNGTSQQTVLMWNGTEVTDADGSGRESEAMGQGVGGHYDTMRFDPVTGFPAICYQSTNPSSGNYVTYKKWNGSAWCDAAGVPNGVTQIAVAYMPNRVCMDLDSAGNPHIVWNDSNLHDILYIKWNGSEWVDNDGTGTESLSVYNNAATNIRQLQIVVANDVPHVVFSTDGGAAPFNLNCLQRLAGGAWVDADGSGTESMIVTPVSDLHERSFRLKKDRAGGVYIAWMEDYLAINLLRKIGAAWVDVDGTGTESVKVKDVNTNHQEWFDVESGNWNNLHVVWTQNDPTFSLHYLRWNGSAWVDPDGVGQSNALIYRGGNFSVFPRIGVDNNNTPYVSCFESTGSVYDYFALKGSCFPQIASPTITRTATPTFTVTITPSYSAGTPTRTFTETQTPTAIPGVCGAGAFDLKINTANACATGDRLQGTLRVYNRSGGTIDVSRFTIKMWFNTANTLSVNFNDRRIEAQGDQTLNTAAGISPYVYAGSPGRLANQEAVISLSGNTAWTPGGVVKIDFYVQASGENPFDPACDDYTRFTALGDTPYVGLYLDGVLVSERLADCNPDPLTGVEPCSIPTGTLTFTATPTFTPTVDGFFPDDTVITGGTGNEEGRSSCTDGSGNIYVAVLEWDDGCTCYVIYIYKYMPGGQLDTSFGTGGRMKCPGVDVHYSWNDRLEIKCDPSGRPVVVAYTDPCGGTCADMIIYRCTPIGVPDTTFNGTGYRICHNIAWTGQSFGYGFDIDANNKLVCTGKAWNGTTYDMILVRCNEDGSIDTTFGTGGCVKYPSPVGDACGIKTKCRGGKIYTIGYVDEFDASCSCTVRVMYIWCHNEDGTIDASFGTGGCTKYVNAPANHKNCIPTGITITVGGKIVVIGSVDDGTACDITCKSMILWVYDIGGTPDTSFDGDGMLVSNPTGQGSCGNDVFVDDNGYIIGGGTIYNGSNKDMCVWKYDFGGNPVTSFGGTGRRTLDTGNDEECMSILELMLCRKVATGFTYNGPKQYDVILWNIEDMCPSHTPTATMTLPLVFTDTPTPTMTRTATRTNTCVCTVSFTITLTPTTGIPETFTSTPVMSATISATTVYSYTPTLTITGTATFTVTRTVTTVITPTHTVTLTPPCPAGTPGFTVHLVYNPEHEQQDHVVVEITSSVPLLSPPAVEIHPHGNTDVKPVEYGTAEAVSGDTTGTRFQYFYHKNTGWGDIDSVLVSGTDTCGQAGTGGGDYTKETISQKDVIVFKNLINPEKDERTRIVFNVYENDDRATVRIYNKSAALVKTLFDGPVTAGAQPEVIWDGTNDAGQKVVSGVYVVVVQTDYYTAREKVAVIH